MNREKYKGTSRAAFVGLLQLGISPHFYEGTAVCGEAVIPKRNVYGT